MEAFNHAHKSLLKVSIPFSFYRTSPVQFHRKSRRLVTFLQAKQHPSPFTLSYLRRAIIASGVGRARADTSRVHAKVALKGGGGDRDGGIVA